MIYELDVSSTKKVQIFVKRIAVFKLLYRSSATRHTKGSVHSLALAVSVSMRVNTRSCTRNTKKIQDTDLLVDLTLSHYLSQRIHCSDIMYSATDC